MHSIAVHWEVSLYNNSSACQCSLVFCIKELIKSRWRNILLIKNAKIVVFFFKMALDNSTRHCGCYLEVVHQNTRVQSKSGVFLSWPRCGGTFSELVCWTTNYAFHCSSVVSDTQSQIFCDKIFFFYNYHCNVYL